MRISSKRNRKKSLLIVLGLIIVVALAGAFMFLQNSKSSHEEGSVNYSPATKDDKEYNDSLKANMESGKKEDSVNSNNENQEDTVRNVSPVITAYGQPGGPGTNLVLNGFVPGVIEDGGICTLTLTKADKKAAASKPALRNAQDTSCGQISIPYSDLGSTGSWSAILSYSSPSTSGSSKVTQIEIK